MTYIQAVILGIIQGLTEFLPISSSAHLVLFPYIMNWKIPAEQVFPFDVLVQLGTLLAVIIYFWKDLWNILTGWLAALVHRKPFESESARMGWYLILATIPAGILGVLIKSEVEAAFNSPRATAIFLFVTAALLLVAEFVGRKMRELASLNWKDALWFGVFQAFSIFPGVSRSGSTITGGMLRNFDRPAAARFSFLMSIPIMLAAGLLSALDLRGVPGLSGFMPHILVGILVAAVIGYLSIRWLLGYLTRHSLVVFSIYCAVVGALVLVISYVR